MKPIITLLALLCTAQISFAQFTQTSTGVTSTQDNVGIGNANPNDKLVVAGAIRTNVGGTPGYGSFGGGFVAFDQNNGGNHLFSFTRQGNSLGISSFESIGFSINTNAPSTNYKMFLNGGGYLGIGTITPGAPLAVFNSNPIVQIRDNDVNPADGSSIGRISFGSTNEYASIEASRFGNNLDDVTYIKFNTSWAPGAGGDGSNLERMRITPEGALAIGTTDAKGYKLAVNGSMIATSIKVKNYTNWPDYVFKRNYKLRPLSEVKSYIAQNNHLPGIPSAKEVEKEGMDVAEMNKLLLKKVEELTLYLIAKDEENKGQQEAINSQKETIKKIQKRLDSLEKAKH